MTTATVHPTLPLCGPWFSVVKLGSVCSVQESSRRMQEGHESRMLVNRHAFGSSRRRPRSVASAHTRTSESQSPQAASAAVGNWDVSEAVPVERETTRDTSGQLSVSASASGDMSLMIAPGDSVSQQRGPPPKQARCLHRVLGSTALSLRAGPAIA